jgi:hypothetical protein
MLFTFIFLGLNTVLQPFCTLALSRLQSCTLLAQIISLFGGLMLILQKFIDDQARTAGIYGSDSLQPAFFDGLIYLINGVVICWPALQIMLLGEVIDTLLRARTLFRGRWGQKAKAATELSEVEAPPDHLREAVHACVLRFRPVPLPEEPAIGRPPLPVKMEPDVYAPGSDWDLYASHTLQQPLEADFADSPAHMEPDWYSETPAAKALDRDNGIGTGLEQVLNSCQQQPAGLYLDQ